MENWKMKKENKGINGKSIRKKVKPTRAHIRKNRVCEANLMQGNEQNREERKKGKK